MLPCNLYLNLPARLPAPPPVTGVRMPSPPPVPGTRMLYTNQYTIPGSCFIIIPRPQRVSDITTTGKSPFRT